MFARTAFGGGALRRRLAFRADAGCVARRKRPRLFDVASAEPDPIVGSYFRRLGAGERPQHIVANVSVAPTTRDVGVFVRVFLGVSGTQKKGATLRGRFEAAS